MTLKDRNDARYLENIVGNRDFQMFVCGSRQDEELLQKQAHESRWRINSTVVQSSDVSPIPFYIPSFTIELNVHANFQMLDFMRKLGILRRKSERVCNTFSVDDYTFF